MRIDQLLVGLVIFSMFVVGGSLLFKSTTSTYDVDFDNALFNGSTNENSSNESVYGILDDMDKDITGKLQEKIVGDESSSSDTNAVDVLISSGYSAIVLVGQSFGLVGKIMNSIAATIGIPGWIVGGVFMIFIITVIFAIIYLIMRLNK